MISWTVARLRRGGVDEGLTLIEVIVALLVFATIIAGSIAAVGTVLSMTADNREREVASNLAQQAIDVARDEAVTNIVDQDENITSPVVNDVKFTVRSVVAWVTTKGIDTKCTVPATSGNGALLFRRVSVTVTWVGMRGTTKPVRADTVVSPTSKINDPTLGTVLISVQSVRGTGGVGGVTASIAPDPTVAPNTATIVPASGQPGRTNNDGCTVATKLSPGSYTVTLSPPAGTQYRDPLQAPNPVKRSITVAAGDSSGASFTYDPAMDAQPAYASNLPGGFAIAKDLTTSFVSSYGATTITPPASDVYLSPVPSGYQVYAGLYAPAGTVSPTTGADTSCLSSDPTTWPAKPGTTVTPPGTAVADAANPTSPATAPVNMGGTTVTIPKGDTIIQAVTTTPASGDPGCKATQTLTFTRTGNSGAGNADVKIALPYGTWGVRSGTSLANLRAITLKDVIGGLLGTGTSTNVVTIDPRIPS